jgi:hypothetical protein
MIIMEIRNLKSFEQQKNLKNGLFPYSGLELTIHVIKSQKSIS